MERDFSSLEIYQLAEDLVVDVYKLSKAFPKEELFGITSQLRRAAISIPLNIAEGYGRYHFKDKALFIYNSRGSLLEVKSIILICFKLGLISKGDRENLITKIDKLGVKINNFIRYLKNRNPINKQ